MKNLQTPSLIGLFTLALLTSACVSGPHSRTFVRASTVVADDMRGEASSGPLSLQGEPKYESFEVAVGTAVFDLDDTKKSSWEVGVSNSRYEKVDAHEYLLGTRHYFGGNEPWFPYLAAQLAYTDFDEDDVGGNVDGQWSIRPGIGTEIGLTKNLYIDFLGGYQFSVVSAEHSSGADFNIEGFSIRVGVGYQF